jgi:hypothetical protein
MTRVVRFREAYDQRLRQTTLGAPFLCRTAHVGSLLRLAHPIRVAQLSVSSARIESRTSAIVIATWVNMRVMPYGPAIAHAKEWSMFGAAAVGYGRDQYRI